MRNLTRLSLLSALTLLLLSACRPQPIIIETTRLPTDQATAVDQANYSLSVQGLATLQVTPNRLDLHIRLQQDERRPDRAIASIRKRQGALDKAIDAAGLAKVERSIGRLSLDEHFERVNDVNIKVGYTASVMMTISMTDFDKVGEFMQLASDNGADSMHTQFRCTRLSELKMQVRADAVAAAKAKAEQLSRLSGAKLGAVVGLSESDYRGAYWGQSSVANSYTPAAVENALQLGDNQELSIQVTIAYRMLAG